MRHGTLTVITRLRPGRREQVERHLEAIERTHAPFLWAIPELHYARWATLDLSAPGTPADARDLHLVLGADFTLEDEVPPEPSLAPSHRQDAALGALDARFLSLLVDHLVARRRDDGHSDFDALYQHCEGYGPGLDDPDHVKDWLRSHTVDFATRHVELVYRVETAQGLRNLVDLHLRAVKRLRTPLPLQDGAPARLLERRCKELRALDPALGDRSWVTGKLIPERLASARAAVAIPLQYLRFVPRLLLLRYRKAARDLVGDVARGVRGLARRLAWSLLGLPTPEEPVRPVPIPSEDPARLVQLSLMLSSPIRSGPLGLRQVELALRLVNARLQRYVVGLNEIQTIHCARWLLYSPPPRDGAAPEHFLLFMAVYDNSWEDYIDAFVDNAEVRKFLVAIWRNTEGFPVQGPRLPFTPRRPFVEPFKRWIRSIEVPTRVAYSAFLHGGEPQPVSVLNLHSALLLRELLTDKGCDIAWEKQRSPEVRALTAFLSGGVCPVGRPFPRWPSAAWTLLKARFAPSPRRAPLPRPSPPPETAYA